MRGALLRADPIIRSTKTDVDDGARLGSTSQRMSGERRRFAVSLLLSLLLHVPLLSLTFGSHGLGLPSFDFPWRVRSIETPALRIVLVPRQPTAATPAPAAVPLAEKAVTSRSDATRSMPPAPPLREKAIVSLPSPRNPTDPSRRERPRLARVPRNRHAPLDAITWHPRKCRRRPPSRPHLPRRARRSCVPGPRSRPRSFQCCQSTRARRA